MAAVQSCWHSLTLYKERLFAYLAVRKLRTFLFSFFFFCAVLRWFFIFENLILLVPTPMRMNAFPPKKKEKLTVKTHLTVRYTGSRRVLVLRVVIESQRLSTRKPPTMNGIQSPLVTVYLKKGTNVDWFFCCFLFLQRTPQARYKANSRQLFFI